MSSRPWSAQWVWPAETKGPDNSYTYFRIEFDVEHPERHLLHISADTRYRLWVNEILLGDGPPPSVPNLVYYDTHDLSTFLSSGRNCIAIVVRYTGIEPGRQPGFLAECETPGGVILATGQADWQCQQSVAWVPFTFRTDLNLYDPYQEGFVARREPDHWKLPGFDPTKQEPSTYESDLLEFAGKFHSEATWKKWKSADTSTENAPNIWTTPNVVSYTHGDNNIHIHREVLQPTPIPPMREEPLRPRTVNAIDECLSLENRTRHDLTILLSQVGRELRSAKVLNPENFITGKSPVVLSRSDDHVQDRTVDGVYDPCVLLDFGGVRTAYVEFDVEGPDGATLDLGFAERLIDGHFNNAIDGQFAARYVLKEGRQRWRTSAWRGFRYLRLRLTDGESPVTIHDFHAVITEYPFQELGSFSSSNERLDGIFRMCRNTIQLCSHTGISDTPWREQCQNLGDVAAVTVGGIYACFGDTALSEKFYRQAAATQSRHGTLAAVTNAASTDTHRESSPADYNLWWVIGALDHFRYTGNLSFARDMFDVARKVLDRAIVHRTDYGLFRPFNTVLIDWANVDRSGECAPYNAILYGALRAGIELAEIVHETPDARRWTKVASELREAFLPRFWSNDREVIVDSADETTQSKYVSEHANFAAIRFNLIPDDIAADVATRLLVKREVDATEAQPFFTAVVLDALHSLGRDDLAIDIILDRWGSRMLDRGATSCHEEWGCNSTWRSGSYAGRMRSLSHAWSAHPATFLVKHLAGIEIIEPGCRVLRIVPARVEMDFHSTFPTPLGLVDVHVKSGHTHINVPDSITVIQR